MMQTIKRTVFSPFVCSAVRAALLSAVLFAASPAKLAAQPACDKAAFAAVERELQQSVVKAKAYDQEQEKAIKAKTEKLVEAKAWTQSEAAGFYVSMLSSKDFLALQERKKAHLNAITGAVTALGRDIEKNPRGNPSMCKNIADVRGAIQDMVKLNAGQWKLMHDRLQAVAKEKKVNFTPLSSTKGTACGQREMFGVQIGAEAPLSQMTNRSAKPSFGTYEYSYTPKTAYPLFTSYRVRTTLKRPIATGVTAEYQAASAEQTDSVIEQIKDDISRRYGCRFERMLGLWVAKGKTIIVNIERTGSKIEVSADATDFTALLMQDR